MVDYNEMRKKFQPKKPRPDSAKRSSRAAIKAIAREYELKKAELQGKIDALKEALKGEDIEAIKAKQEELTKTFYAVSEKIYQTAAAAQGAEGGVGPDGSAAPDSEGFYDGTVN
jgi:hypothetical protein